MISKDTYVSLLLPKDKEDALLLTVIYGKYGNEWKINVLQFGQYCMSKKTASDFYDLAKKSYGKAYLVDAVNYISLAKQCLKPAENYLTFTKEKEINTFFDQVMTEVNSKFHLPMILANVPTKPSIFRVLTTQMNEGIFPMVYYATKIDLKDLAALKQENDQVIDEVNKLFTGINKEKKYVFYRAYSQLPNGQLGTAYYGFAEKLEPKDLPN
jgi:hypothetical protein